MLRLTPLAIPLFLATSLAAQGPVVVIDPGHGGDDPGFSVGVVAEKQLTLSVANALATALIDAGFDARLTRTDDERVSLEDRVSFAESAGAVAYVSLHFGAGPRSTSASGGAIFVSLDDQRSIELGEAVALAVADLPLPFAAPASRNFHVLSSNRVPAVLVELGNIADPVERETVSAQAYQDAAVGGLVAGIRQYVGDHH